MLSNRTIVSGRISDRGERKFEGPCREQWGNNFVTKYRRKFREMAMPNTRKQWGKADSENAFHSN